MLDPMQRTGACEEVQPAGSLRKAVAAAQLALDHREHSASDHLHHWPRLITLR